METNGHDVSVFSTVSEWAAMPVLCSVYTVERRRSRLPSGVTSAVRTGHRGPGTETDHRTDHRV